MQCVEFEDRLNAVLDLRQRPEWDSELRSHCENCTSCRDLSAAYGLLLDGFYAMATPEPRADLAARVLDELRAQPADQKRWSNTAAWMALAAALLVALVPLLRMNATTSTTSTTVAKAPQKTLPTFSLNEVPIVPGLLARRQASDADAATDLAKETGQGLAVVLLHVPGVGGTGGIIDLDAQTAANEPAWVRQMSQGFKPVTDSVTDTVDLLLRSLDVTDIGGRS